jgi:hypothetical protein
MHPNRRYRIGGRSVIRLAFAAGWCEVTRWIGSFRPSLPKMRWVTYKRLRAVDAALQEQWLLDTAGSRADPWEDEAGVITGVYGTPRATVDGPCTINCSATLSAPQAENPLLWKRTDRVTDARLCYSRQVRIGQVQVGAAAASRAESETVSGHSCALSDEEIPIAL